MMDSEKDLKTEERLGGKPEGRGQKEFEGEGKMWYDSYISALRARVHGDILH